MAITAEVQALIDKAAELKSKLVDEVIAFTSRYESIASDLANPDAVSLLNELNTDYLSLGSTIDVELKAYNAERRAVEATLSPEDAADASAAFTAIASDINTNVTKQLKDIKAKIPGAIESATKLASENDNPPAEGSNPDNTKAPESGDGDQAGDGASGSTTVAGKAGKSKVSDDAQSVGLRDYNPLSQFSSYTYKVGLYMMNTTQLNAYMAGDYTVIKDFWLIAQSGGVTPSLDSPRAPGFDLDIYLDDIEIETIINAKEAETATNSINFKFKVYEPFGFSFPHKITQAMVQSQQRNASLTGNTLEQIKSLNEGFFITIKFYGYDKDGNIVNANDYTQPGVIKSDSQSVFERGFPIRLKDFKFRLENKMTVYNITAVQYSEQVGKGVNSGTVPAKISLAGETVRDVLVGKSQNSSKKSVMGLADILNQMELDELKKDKPRFKFPNKYKIEFEESDGIADALLVPKDYYVKEKTPMGSIEGSSTERDAWKKRLGTVEKKTRSIEIPAGQPIIQAIDNIIGQSEYIKSMLLAVDKEVNDPVQENEQDSEVNSNPKTLSWYNINVSAIRSPEWDPQRNDYAHEITFKITKYEIPYIRSLYATNTKQYYGPHKRYNYWYTGENTEILSYEQEYNLMYTIEGPMASEVATENLQSAKTKLKTGQGGVDATTAKSGKNDIVNSVKSFLYSPGDLNKFKIKILGDPDYLMPSIGNTSGGGVNRWYGTDFSINPNSGQVFIEIKFQQVEDYDNNTGLMDPNNDILFTMYSDQLKTKPKGLVYMLTHVNSIFSRGKFEQTLKGFLPEFARDASKNSATPDPNANPRQNQTGGFDKGSGGNSWDDPNQTKDTQKRTGVDLTKNSAGGGRGVAQIPPNGVASDDNPGGAPQQSYSGVILSKDASARDPVTLLPKRQ
jgi:hypothetical protein